MERDKHVLKAFTFSLHVHKNRSKVVKMVVAAHLILKSTQDRKCRLIDRIPEEYFLHC